MRLMLAGGGNADQSKAIDLALRERLARRRFLFLPQAITPEDWSVAEARAWINKPEAFADVEITVWESDETPSIGRLAGFDAVYMMGGNTFRLLDKFRRSGFDTLLVAYVESGGLLYGISAGAIIMGRDISPASIGPERDENTPSLVDFSGLSLLSDVVVTHYSSQEKPALEKLQLELGTRIVAIPETAGVIVEGDDASVVGDSVTLFESATCCEVDPGGHFTVTRPANH